MQWEGALARDDPGKYHRRRRELALPPTSPGVGACYNAFSKIFELRWKL
jgi:hypothetical protein